MSNSHERGTGYSTVTRLLALRNLLRTEPHTWEQIQTRLPNDYTDDENGKRKLRMDLQALCQMGCEVKRDRVARTYAVAIRKFEYDWTESDLAALAALRDSFTEGTPHAETIQAILARIEEGLDAKRRQVYARKSPVSIKFAAVQEPSPAVATRQKLEEALTRHQRIRFQYRPSNRPQVITHPDDEPIEIVFEDGHYYLWAYCYKMNKTYPFRVDMIVPDSVEILPKRAEGRWQRQTIHFKYWLSPKIAARGVSPRFPDMDYDIRSDGSVIVTAQAYSDFYAIQGILRYGEHAEILSPDWLRAKMRRVVQQMGELYSRAV